MWAALTALFVTTIIVTVAAAVWVFASVFSFLQPILIPVAIAAILAYLLDPLVTRICRNGIRRTPAVLLIFVLAGFAITGLVWWLVPTISMQSANFTKELPNYTQKARDNVVDLLVRFNRAFGSSSNSPRGKTASPTSGLVNWLLGSPTPRPSATAPPASPTPPAPDATPEPLSTPTETIAPAPAKLTSADRQRIQAYVEKQIPNIERYLPTLSEKIWTLFKRSIGGFLGITGFLLSLVMVPIYLFFFLAERPRIESRWKEYLPLRASPLKDEVAEVLTDINHYVVAYFRGQLLVCLVDGCLIGSALTLFGLNFAPLIGVLVVILTMIPYIGIFLCWIPAVMIAAFQFGDWWHPFWVTMIFVAIQNAEGMFYAPRIVGDSVGLHPLTVIMSIFIWGLLIGGLLGPLLAVPLTATLKVLLARYVWEPRLRNRVLREPEQLPVVAHPP